MKDDDGYTLVEITVAILVSGLVATIIYGVYLFGVRLHTDRLAATTLHMDLHAAAVRLATDIEEAEHVVPGTTPWLVLRTGHAHIEYRADSSGLYRNARLMIGDELLSARLTAVPTCTTCHELRITARWKEDTLAVRRLIRQRRAFTWRPEP